MDDPLTDAMLDASGVEEDEAERVRQAISAHTVGETRLCKRESCVNEEEDYSGPLAGLCSKHKEERREERRREREASRGRESGVDLSVGRPESGSAATGPVDLVGLAKSLERPAKRVTRALAAKKTTAAEAREALGEFQSTLTAIRDAAQKLIEEAR